MKDRNRSFRLGLFVLGGLIVLLGMLFFLGMSDLFSHKAAVCTYFSESVQGLSVGSEVKYRGVAIGTVSKIIIRVSDQLVQVNMEIGLDHFVNVDAGGRRQQIADFNRFFRSELEKGMRCRLEYTGITGLRYIDFDYYATPGQALPEEPLDADVDQLFIPAVPSSFHDILKAIGTSLDRISRVRFEEISDGLERSFSELSGLLSDPALKSMIERVNGAALDLQSTSRTIAGVINEERLERLMDLLEADLKMVRELGEQWKQESREAKIPESTAAFREAAASLVTGSENFGVTLFKLNRALDAMTELVEYLNQDPGSLVRGKSSRPVTE